MGRFIVRLLVATGAALGTAFVVVLVLTIADLYLVGHGYPSINREVIDWPAAGVRLSPAGAVLLASFVIAWCVAWIRTRHRA